MSDTNQVVLIGRLTRDAELRSTTNGKAVSKFFIAVNKKWKAGDEWKESVGFFEIVIWGQLAESLQQYLTKGKQVAVTGELTQERWGGDDGKNHSKVTVTASTIQLLGGGTSNADSNTASPSSPPQGSRSAVAANDNFADDIPF
jgi:single-strand DNA-binding protein